MTPVRIVEQTFRAWSSPILLELKARENQLDSTARQALHNVLAERGCSTPKIPQAAIDATLESNYKRQPKAAVNRK